MREPTARRLVRRLIDASFVVGVISTLSYGAQIQNLLRATAPAAGAWWSDYEFYFMTGAATALGLSVALRIGLHFVEPESRGRIALVALALDAVLIVPLTHLCAAVARVGVDGSGAVARSTISSFAGYAAGKLLDKLVVAGTYFLKTATFGFLVGLGLFGAVLAGVILTIGSGRIATAESPQADPK
jgi:hypothetical protein